MSPQLGNSQNRQRDKTAPIGLGTLLDWSAMFATGAAGNNSQLSTIEINIAPAEGTDFATTHTAENAE
jgi:hypothetical protein